MDAVHGQLVINQFCGNFGVATAVDGRRGDYLIVWVLHAAFVCPHAKRHAPITQSHIHPLS